MAADHPVNKQWADQETWIQFTEKESDGGFKTNRPHPHPATSIIKHDSVLAPLYTPPEIDSGSTVGMPVILDTNHSPEPVLGQNSWETTLLPVRRNTVGMPFYSGDWWGGRPYWGSHGYGGNSYLGNRMFNPGGYAWRPITRSVQTGPSKSSGNYFNPSTPDPSASGNYFAPSGNAPKAMPVYQPEPQPTNFWGKQGNPLPDDVQPD